MSSEPTASGSEERLIIALDFGTTFSGIAYAFWNPGAKPALKAIETWPGREGHRQPKVPTLIAYEPSNPNEFKWGGQVNWRDNAVHGVKLLLDPDQPRPKYLPAIDVKAERQRLPKDEVSVAVDFISTMYKHALSVIESSMPKNYVDLCEKQFVLTVPAVWSDTAKDKTLKAAKRAGLHPCVIVKEPEAAALYTLHVQERALSVGDAFVVCDAGGGTVDLITYEVQATTPTLKLAELVPGNGGMAGSLGLNTRFAEAVRELVDEGEWARLQNSHGFSRAQEEFDKEVKPSFKGDLEADFYINFPKAGLKDNLAEGLEDSCWTMSGEQVEKLFDPLIQDVLRLIADQVKKALVKRPTQAIKGIFLVGGFGSSRYLKTCVERQHPDIQVIQPDDAWAAIVKGAVLSRMPYEATVVSTQAVRHYGVDAMCLYEPAIDHGRRTVVCPFDGMRRCNRMTWYIYMGEDLQRDQTIRFPFFRSLDKNFRDNELIFYDTLIESQCQIAPQHPDRGINTKTNCRLVSDLRSIDRSLLKSRIGIGGRPYFKIHYDLVVSTQFANMKFSLEIGGVEMGRVEATYA